MDDQHSTSIPYSNYELFSDLIFDRNIIDVGAMDSHNLEQQELNDRIRMYSHKLSQQWGTLQDDSTSAMNGKVPNKMPTTYFFEVKMNLFFSYL